MVRANMEGAIKTVVTVFLKSAKGKENLGGKDFQNLVKNQLKNILTDTDSSEAIKNMRQGLDSNQDGKVSFQEYMTLIGYLAQAVSQQRCTKETQVASSGPETQAEAPEAPKAEPEAEKEVKPVKEEEPAKEQDEAVEVVELVEEEVNVKEVVEIVERT
ncbi:S100 calcium binding protein U isoform X2 [Hemibagrus wyckioides]|uniref:S100 calcium binding protein U isoform X1 n=2 Tax=Hemibagrus wyckioides TaxID=337641 RepID=UPI00266C9274|nr:S100 calcium binding protein U isoform X1 [Hemibagrus wyckioides]XP_058261208.1 S100 calcium binding protein U isoform X2 [Hemibagrus wyckioides]